MFPAPHSCGVVFVYFYTRMNELKRIFKEHRIYFTGYFVFVIVCVLLMTLLNKAQSFALLNPYHEISLNDVFYFFTFLGDGVFLVVLSLLLALYGKRRLALLILSSYLLSGIVAQTLKAYIDEARPALYSDLKDYSDFIAGVTLHNNHAFPSGHTASAFAAATITALVYSNKKTQWLVLIAAIGVGYSRIYLGQHFVGDVFVGSLIGVVSGVISWMALYKRTWLV
jgi:membrane-associated phospholipid phosphatase